MSTSLTIPAAERHKLRLFQLDLPPEQIRFLREPGAVADLLGCDGLAESGIQLIRIEDLDALGLSGFLVQGCDIPEDQIAANTDALNTAYGTVLALASSAFQDRETTLCLPGKVRLIATLTEEPTDWSGSGPIKTPSALPGSAPRTAPRQARADARRIGGIVFGVFMVLTLLVLWALLT